MDAIFIFSTDINRSMLDSWNSQLYVVNVCQPHARSYGSYVTLLSQGSSGPPVALWRHSP